MRLSPGLRNEASNTSAARDLPSPAPIVRRVLGGDRDAFRSIVETYEPAVFGLCWKWMHGDHGEAEDLTQECFLRAYQRLDQLSDHERFVPWLYQIARSLCRDRRRRQVVERRFLKERAETLRQSQGEAGLPAGSGSPESADLSPALLELPAEEREALQLRYFEGLSYAEVARRLSLTFARVDHLIRKARARLARRVEVMRDRER